MADVDVRVTHEVDRGRDRERGKARGPRQAEHCSAMAVGCLRCDRLRRGGDPGVTGWVEIDDPSWIVLEVLDRQMRPSVAAVSWFNSRRNPMRNLTSGRWPRMTSHANNMALIILRPWEGRP
jgi:hypothetical protein